MGLIHLDILKRLLYFFPLAFLLLGLWALITALDGYLRRKGFLRRALRHEGRVIEQEEVPGGKRVKYRPKIAFQTLEGEHVVFSAELTADKPEFEVGERLMVYYDPADPHTAVPDRFWHLWFWPIFNTVMGGLMLIIGAWLLHDFREALGPAW